MGWGEGVRGLRAPPGHTTPAYPQRGSPTGPWPRTPHHSRAGSPCPSKAPAGPSSISPQPSPAWPWTRLSQAHPRAHIPAWPQPILSPGRCLVPRAGAVPEPPAALLLTGAVGQALAARPCPAPQGAPIALPAHTAPREKGRQNALPEEIK